MTILASYNIKGGVGKTTAAVNLAYLAAREGAQTLVWDLDPQGAASYYYRIKPKVKGGSKALVRGKRQLEALIKGTDYDNLDLVPADFSYRHMDLVLDNTKKPTRRLRKLLAPLADEYDYIFLDCAPSISLVTENIFQAADALLIPTIPSRLSLRTLRQIMDFCERSGLSGLKLLPFFSMVDRRKKMHRSMVEEPPEELPAMLSTSIPYASEVERMGVARAALASFAGRSHAALAFEALWQEIKARLV